MFLERRDGMEKRTRREKREGEDAMEEEEEVLVAVVESPKERA